MNQEIINKLLENKSSLIKEISQTKKLCPKFEDIFNAFNFFNLKDTNVVILGQDPYHGHNVADGLAFSTRQAKTPMSLSNIFKELKNEYPNVVIETNNLSSWAKQGVLLLNTALTTIENKPNYHKNIGWYEFVIDIIKFIDNNCNYVVFNLWGKAAHLFQKYITNKNNFIIKTSHPSPFSFYKGFWNSNVFSRTNNFLKINKKIEIDWNLKKE